MIDALLNEIAAHGARGAVVPVSRFGELKSEMEGLGSQAYHAYSDFMAKSMAIPGDLGFEPQSLISVVAPSPKVMYEFRYRGKPVRCVVPPQYADEGSKDEEILQGINAFLEPLGKRAALICGIPQKLLAVRCGLARYGRNNICFHEEFGSYIRILSYISDFPCGDAPWFEARRMEACEKCSACRGACPTKAIEPSQRIVNTAVCLTAMNEASGEFPAWVDRDAHNSLVGCMACQDCCPGNAQNRDNTVEGLIFSEEETAELLGHRVGEPYSDRLAAKMEATRWISPRLAQWLPRNLAVLLPE